MLYNYSPLFNDLIHGIVEDKLIQSISSNSEIKEQHLDENKYKKAFSDLLNRLNETDRNIIDDYLSLNNCINSILFCDVYKYGFYDCIDLLKELRII